MFLPASLYLILTLLWILVAALAGAGLGWYSADLLRLERRRAWLDALTGAAAILLLFALVGAVASHGTTTVLNGHTLGRRGILLNHLIAWAIGFVSLSVVGRQLVVVRYRQSPAERAAAAGT